MLPRRSPAARAIGLRLISALLLAHWCNPRLLDDLRRRRRDVIALLLLDHPRGHDLPQCFAAPVALPALRTGADRFAANLS